MPDHTRALLRELPPYNPAFNTIERAFAKFKSLRQVQVRAAHPRRTNYPDRRRFPPQQIRRIAGYDAT